MTDEMDFNYALDAICQGPVNAEMVVKAREFVREQDAEIARLKARVGELTRVLKECNRELDEEYDDDDYFPW